MFIVNSAITSTFKNQTVWAENTLKRSKQEWGLYLAAVWTLSWIKAPRASVWIIPQKALFITHHTESNRPSSQTHRQKQVHYFHLNRLASRRSGLSGCECVSGLCASRRCSAARHRWNLNQSRLWTHCGVAFLFCSLWPLRLRLHLSLRSCRKRLKN